MLYNKCGQTSILRVQLLGLTLKNRGKIWFWSSSEVSSAFLRYQKEQNPVILYNRHKSCKKAFFKL